MRGIRPVSALVGVAVVTLLGCSDRGADFREHAPGYWVMIVDPPPNRDDLLKAAKERCRDRIDCTVAAWTNEADAPGRALNEEDLWEAMIFRYTRNLKSGDEHILWNCSVYPSPPVGTCRGSPIIDYYFPETDISVPHSTPTPTLPPQGS